MDETKELILEQLATGFITDSKIILIASFSQLKGLTLDGDSALSMIQLFKTELRDQYCFIEDDEDIEDAIDYFERIVEESSYKN